MLTNSQKKQLPDFIKYPKIPYTEESPKVFGRDCYAFEKIDGSLCQVRKTESEILGGSKANYITGSTKRPGWALKFLKWMYSNHSLYNLKPGLIMYGEWLDPVTIEYEQEFLDQFYFIDLATIKNGKPQFFDYEEAQDYLAKWNVSGFHILPPIGKRFLDEQSAKNLVLEQQSYIRNGDMEGIVLKNYHLQLFGKVLHPKYSEIREQEKELEMKYLTDIRVKKAIRRLNDNGNLSPNLEEVIEEVVLDIREETTVSFDPTAVKGVIRARNLFHSDD